MQKLDSLKAAAEAARALAAANRTPENMQAAREASAALSAYMTANGLLPKPRGFASRAGRRQAAERRGG